MLAWIGAIAIVALFGLIITKRLSPLVALIVVPVAASLAAGFGLATGKFIVHGVQNIGPIAGMFVLRFFFRNPHRRRDARSDHRGRAARDRLPSAAYRDGAGAARAADPSRRLGRRHVLVTLPAMMPLYTRLGMDRRILACVASMAAGVNFLPWVGPMLRASAALHIPGSAIFMPMIPVQIVGPRVRVRHRLRARRARGEAARLIVPARRRSRSRRGR